MALQWLAVNLLTGSIICDLPTLESKDPFRRTIGQYETSTATLTVTDSIDPDWEQGILEGTSACLAYTGAPGNEVVVWGGVVLQAPRNLGNTIELGLITPEGLLDRCFVGAYTTDPTGVGATRDQNLIVTDLAQQFAVTANGFPFITQVVGAAGTPRLFACNNYDDKTVYSNLQSLMGLQAGPEWTVDWQWNHTTGLIFPLLTVGTRLGTPVMPGMGPGVTFDETQMTEATIPHDWSKSAGANFVTATGTGTGLARATATATATNLAGRARYEYRWAPSTSIFDTLTLSQHASKALAVLQMGNQSVSFTAVSELPGLSLGSDWFIGDDLGYSIQSPTIPTRVEGVSRCIGYEASQTTIKPLLYTPGIV